MTRRIGPKLVASAVVITLISVATLTTAPAVAGSNAPEAGRLYRSGDGSGASMRLLAVGERPDGRPLVVVAATFECDELELEGVVLAPVKANGSFRVESGGFALTGGGTDEVDAEVDLRGRFRGARVEGSIAAEAEAFDNAGTTGTCDEEIDWDAHAGAVNAALERVEGTVSLTAGPAVVAAGPEAAFVVTTPDEAEEAQLQRVDAATDDVTWEVETGAEIAALAATTDAVWAVDGAGTRVLRFDPATGEQAAAVSLDGAGGDEQLSFTPAVAADDTGAWVAAGDLYRVDPATNAVITTIDLGDDAEDAVLAVGGSGVYAGINRARAVGDAEGPPYRLLRVDPATDAIETETEGVGHFRALAAADEVLWAAPYFEDVRRLDPTTLDDVGGVNVEAAALTSAAPGAWVLTERGVAAYAADAPDDPEVRIPLIGGDFGTIAASGDAVWVWDARLGTLTRVEAG